MGRTSWSACKSSCASRGCWQPSRIIELTVLMLHVSILYRMACLSEVIWALIAAFCHQERS
jgi:hypothetical protein